MNISHVVVLWMSAIPTHQELGFDKLYALILNDAFCLAAGHFLVIAKLKDLLPTLMCFFKDLFSLVHSTASLELNSFESMLSILRSIDIAVRFLISRSLSRNPDVLNSSTLDGPLTTLILRELLMLFPLHSLTHVSGKVWHPTY